VPADPRPAPAQIRRALAECMTVGDIDDAMGWEPGTARRRRWRGPDRGGLPFADVELGGVALWFRSTVEAWQEQPDGPAPSDDHPAPGDQVDEVEDVADEPDGEGAAGAEEDVAGPAAEAPGAEDPGQEAAAQGDDGSDPAAVRSGYDLELGQQVLADVQGRWREARIRHRDRTTVAVDYNLDGTPMGARRQRVGLDRIRVLDG
jgi:hypothetical protein